MKTTNYMKIDEIYAFLSIDEKGNEGVCSAQMPSGNWLPMLAADMARVNDLRNIAEHISKQSGLKIRLCKFSTKTVVEVIGE